MPPEAGNLFCKMTRNVLLKTLIFNAFVTFLGTATWAASLELGQVRANRRGWVDRGVREAQVQTESEGVAEESRYVTEEGSGDEIPAELGAPPGPDAKPDKKAAKLPKGEAGPGLLKRGLMLIGRGEKQPTLRDGYLTIEVPPALRFSDRDPVNTRPPSPALPEFNFVSNEYMPYLIETALSKDELDDAEMLSELVIELAPHEIVSGMIDTRRRSQEELVESFNIEESSTTVLRPEEVLIYFETDTSTGKAGALVPFSPATPSANPTIKSSATFKKE